MLYIDNGLQFSSILRTPWLPGLHFRRLTVSEKGVMPAGFIEKENIMNSFNRLNDMEALNLIRDIITGLYPRFFGRVFLPYRAFDRKPCDELVHEIQKLEKKATSAKEAIIIPKVAVITAACVAVCGILFALQLEIWLSCAIIVVFAALRAFLVRLAKKAERRSLPITGALVEYASNINQFMKAFGLYPSFEFGDCTKDELLDHVLKELRRQAGDILAAENENRAYYQVRGVWPKEVTSLRHQLKHEMLESAIELGIIERDNAKAFIRNAFERAAAEQWYPEI